MENESRTRRGFFDPMCDALFAQMEKLQAVDQHDEQAMKLEIERSRAVSQLAGNMIANADTAIRLMRFQADCGMEMGGIVSTVPKMLRGAEQ